jgi:type VI secretion system protein
MSIRPDYGLPDISELVHSFPDAADSLAKALVRTIEAYEPRLTQVRVVPLPMQANEWVVRFEVTAILAASLDRTPVRFETRIDSSRRVSVA